MKILFNKDVIKRESGEVLNVKLTVNEGVWTYYINDRESIRTTLPVIVRENELIDSHSGEVMLNILSGFINPDLIRAMLRKSALT